MIKPGSHFQPKPPAKDLQQPVSNTNREDHSYRVNWLTQKGQRQPLDDLSLKKNHLIDGSIKHFKMCLQKEITLIPSGQNAERCQGRSNHLIQHESAQNSGSHSQKKSSEKRQKLSLISKRPSLRKINNFISFKEEEYPCILKVQQIKQVENIPPMMKWSENQPKKEGKKCIRISARRHCLAEINKN